MKEVSFRKLKGINPEEFAAYLTFNMGMEDDLDVLIEDELCIVVDKPAPIKPRKSLKGREEPSSVMRLKNPSVKSEEERSGNNTNNTIND